MRQQRNIKAISRTKKIDPVKHLNEKQLHLNKYGTIEFVKNLKKFISKIDGILIILRALINIRQVSLILLGILFVLIIMKI